MADPAYGPAAGGKTGAGTDRDAAELRLQHEHAIRYIREKTNQLLTVMGTAPLRPEELDDDTLIAVDPIGIVADSFRQVIEHLHHTNEELNYAREELQAIFDSAGLGILVIGRDQRILAANAKFRVQFGLAENAWLGRSCREMVCKADRPDRPCPFTGTLDTGVGYRSPDWVVGNRHFDIVETAVRNKAGELVGSVLVYSDITDRVRAEEELRRSEERYRDLFENTNDLIMSARLDGSLEFVNAAWCRTLGYTLEEIEQLTLNDLFHPDCDEECRNRVAALLTGEAGGRVNTKLRAKDGRKVVLEGNVSLVREDDRPVGIRGILRDITDSQLLEEELRRREKLESVGLLAGGIAHDFNNILTAILGNINLALVEGPSAAILPRLQEAERATLAARGLTQQLLTFAQGGAPVKKLAQLESLLREQTVFACRGTSVTSSVEVTPGLWAAEIDQGQIGEVVHNLAINAVQAMPDGGTVRVRADNIDCGADKDPILSRGPYVRIAVQDTGCGIPPENLVRLFDPYFTTKAGGTGLGLAVTHSIVKKHGGHIRVDSEPGQGTTFLVYLPASACVLQPLAEAPEKTPTGRGRILVMDDERIVRDIAREMLTALGYEAVLVSDGASAIESYETARREAKPFDAVIMDLTIPGGMGGQEAVRELLRRDPAACVLVSSGYSSDPVMARYTEHGFRGVIAKPYRLADLATALKSALRE